MRVAVRGWWCHRAAARTRAARADRPLYLFFDESGTFDCKNQQEPLYHFGVLTTYMPERIEQTLAPIRYEVVGVGEEERLHATEDKQSTRDDTYAALRRLGGFEFDALTINKLSLPQELASPAFYGHFAEQLLEVVFQRYKSHRGLILLITDTLPVGRERSRIEKALKTYMHRRMEGRKYVLRHCPSATYGGLQAADYCTWAVHKLRLHRDERPYSEIAPFVRTAREVDADNRVIRDTPKLHESWLVGL
jgi:hypothetical protein